MMRYPTMRGPVVKRCFMNLLSSMRYLVALSEHKHFGRAAQACHITQPALSNAIRALELELGATIVRRDRHFVGLTNEGERVLASSQLILREQALLMQELQSDKDSPKGEIRIGAVPTAMSVAARFGASLHAMYDGISPKIMSMSSDQLENSLADLSLDLALGYIERTNIPMGKLLRWPQYQERYFLLRRADAVVGHRLQLGPTIGWREAAELPLCLLTTDMHNRAIIDAAFTTVGMRVQPAIEVNSSFSMPLCVSDGDVCSIMPGTLLGTVLHASHLEALPLSAPEVVTPIGFMAHASTRPSRAMQAATAWLTSEAWLEKAHMFSNPLHL
jgi:DNA-binding transcriptional LysR family regulator